MALRSKITAFTAAAMVVVACGGSGGGGTPTNPSPNPDPTPSQPTITITASGASPRLITISLGQRVTFVNNNNRPHEMSSDPHPEHTDCPEINLVGFLNPGQSKETGNFVEAKSCGFHDHNQPNVVSLTGRINVR